VLSKIQSTQRPVFTCSLVQGFTATLPPSFPFKPVLEPVSERGSAVEGEDKDTTRSTALIAEWKQQLKRELLFGIYTARWIYVLCCCLLRTLLTATVLLHSGGRYRQIMSGDAGRCTSKKKM
jgi:hypothetical protein